MCPGRENSSNWLGGTPACALKGLQCHNSFAASARPSQLTQSTCAEDIVRQVYVQAFLPELGSAANLAANQPNSTPGMNATQQHRNARQNTAIEDLYPHEPPGFVPGRNTAKRQDHPRDRHTYQPTHTQHPPPNGVHNGQASQHPAARGGGGKHNPNVKCPCGKESYADAKELLVCHTCKSWNRHTLQHASHMGYDMAKFTETQRATHMCEQCRLDHADPFWKQFPELRPGSDPRDGWIVPLTWLKRQVTTRSQTRLQAVTYFDLTRL